MLLVILAICIFLFILEFCIDCDGALAIPFGSLGIVTLIVILVLSVDVSSSRYINDKIAMYQEENAAIEEQVSEAVSAYMEHEDKTFTEVVKSPLVLATLFPELKSDVLVGKQIEVYIGNNNQIKELKLAAIDYNPKRWWLYFG